MGTGVGEALGAGARELTRKGLALGRSGSGPTRSNLLSPNSLRLVLLESLRSFRRAVPVAGT